MKVKLAKNAGFCLGVKKAVDTVFSVKKTSEGEVLTDGPLIHNKNVISMLKKQGIGTLDDKAMPKRATLVIRAHGISPKRYNKYIEMGFNIVDATCPRVQATQRKVKEYSRKNYNVIIVGDHNHAEVLGLIGFADTDSVVISNCEEAKNVKIKEPIAVLVQSTFSKKEFDKIVNVLQKRYENIEIINTLCGVTSRSQNEVTELCKEVDIMIVIGDRMSANTKRLTMLAKTTGIPTLQVEDVDELPLNKLKKYNIAGITAGTSTPGWIIEEVVRKLKSI